MAAARWPPRSEPQNSHDFRPRAIPRSPRSAALFERQTRPSSRNRVKAGQRLSMYCIGWSEVSTVTACDVLSHVNPERVDQRPARVATNSKALLGTLAVDRALDREQRVDAAHDFDSDRRERHFLFRSLATAFASMSAMAKKGRRAWPQHAASRIGPGVRSARYSSL